VEQAAFHALDRIRAVSIQVDATGIGDAEGLWQALTRQGHSLRLQHEGRGIVVAVTIVNATERQRWLRDTDLEAMLDRLRRATDRGPDQGESTEQFLWWDSLRFLSPASIAPEKPIAGEFGSALARAVEQVRSNPERLGAAIPLRAHEMGERLRAQGFDGGDPAALLGQAEQLVARLLADEGAEQ
jgi:hypothetical protein